MAAPLLLGTCGNECQLKWRASRSTCASGTSTLADVVVQTGSLSLTSFTLTVNVPVPCSHMTTLHSDTLTLYHCKYISSPVPMSTW